MPERFKVHRGLMCTFCFSCPHVGQDGFMDVQHGLPLGRSSSNLCKHLHNLPWPGCTSHCHRCPALLQPGTQTHSCWAAVKAEPPRGALSSAHPSCGRAASSHCSCRGLLTATPPVPPIPSPAQMQ